MFSIGPLPRIHFINFYKLGLLFWCLLSAFRMVLTILLFSVYNKQGIRNFFLACPLRLAFTRTQKAGDSRNIKSKFDPSVGKCGWGRWMERTYLCQKCEVLSTCRLIAQWNNLIERHSVMTIAKQRIVDETANSSDRERKDIFRHNFFTYSWSSRNQTIYIKYTSMTNDISLVMEI